MRNPLHTLLCRLGGRHGRLGTVLTVAFVGIVLTAAPAAAAPADPNPNPTVLGGTACASPPAIQSPGAGVTNQLLPQRLGLNTGKDASMFETYGLAGLNFDTYDVGIDAPTGCLPNNESIDGSISDLIANALMTFATGLAALGDSIMRSAYDTSWMQVFDPYIQNVVMRLQTSIFANFAILAMMLIGAILIWRARKADMSRAMNLVGGGVIVFLAATALFAYPITIGHAYDNAVAGVTQHVSDAINGDSALGDPKAPKRTADQSLMNSIYENVFYRAWLSGMFGDPDSDAAQTYGKRLFAAHAMTWDEVDAMNKAAAEARKNPDYGRVTTLNPFGGMLPEGYCRPPGSDSGPFGQAAPVADPVPCSSLPLYQKQADFTKVAAEVKKADPGAYSYLQGKHGEDRIGYAFLALLAVLFSLPVIIIGSLSMACAFLVFRFALVLAPIITPFGMVRTDYAMSLFDRVASIAMTAFVWGIGIPIVEILNGAVFAAKINPVLRLLLLAVIFIVSLVMLFSFAPGFGGLVKKRHAKRGFKWLQTGLGWLAAGKIAKAAASAGNAGPGSPYGGNVPPTRAPSPYSYAYGSPNKTQPPAPPGALPAGSNQPVEATIDPDPTDRSPDDIYVDSWDSTPEPIGAPLPPERGLPAAPESGEIMPDTALPRPTAGQVGREGSEATPAKVNVLEDENPVYVITDQGLNYRDPADFGEGFHDVYGDDEAWSAPDGSAPDGSDLPALPAGSDGGAE